MSPYQDMYGRSCETPLSWERLEDRVTIGPKLIQEMEDQVIHIRQQLKETRDKQKMHVDAHRTDQSYEVGYHVFICIGPNKNTIRFGKGTKLPPQFIRLFKIQERIGPVVYHLVLPSHLHKTNDVFHIYVLRHYIAEESHKLNWKEFQVSEVGTIMVELLRIIGSNNSGII
jgi:hypothetical protein